MFRTVSDRHISGMFGHMKQLTPWPRWGGMSMATFHPRLYDFESMRADIFRKSKAKTTFFWRFRLPPNIFCCSSWPIMLLAVVYFRVSCVLRASHTRRESERAGTWCSRTLTSQCHSSTSCFWDWQGVMSRNAGNLMMTDERAKFQLQFLHLLYLDLSLSSAVPVLFVAHHLAHFLACLVCFVRNWGLGWCSEFWTSRSSSWKCCWLGNIDFWEKWLFEGEILAPRGMKHCSLGMLWFSQRCVPQWYGIIGTITTMIIMYIIRLCIFCFGVIIKSVWFYTKVTRGDLK